MKQSKRIKIQIWDKEKAKFVTPKYTLVLDYDGELTGFVLHPTKINAKIN